MFLFIIFGNKGHFVLQVSLGFSRSVLSFIVESELSLDCDPLAFNVNRSQTLRTY